jgi:hypothetical protein
MSQFGSRHRVAISRRLGERSITVYLFDWPFDDADVKPTFDDQSNALIIKRASSR